jgi:hypothetical protein
MNIDRIIHHLLLKELRNQYSLGAIQFRSNFHFISNHFHLPPSTAWECRLKLPFINPKVLFAILQQREKFEFEPKYYYPAYAISAIVSVKY